jgi:hypothetical protein
MRHLKIIRTALSCAFALLFIDAARAGGWPDDCEESTLPSDDPNYPNDQLILTCLPSDFNGTLVIYAHGYVRPQEPLALPEEFVAADVQELVQRLVDLGWWTSVSALQPAATTRTATRSNMPRPTSIAWSTTSRRESRT